MKEKLSYNQEVLKIIKKRYGYSFDYIRKSIRGDREGVIPDRIKSEYNKLTNAINKMMKDIENEL